jgi:hypothetical protein
MRLDQGKGAGDAWSATHSRQFLASAWTPASDLLRRTPSWVIVESAALVFVAVLVVGYFVGRGLWRGTVRRRKATREARKEHAIVGVPIGWQAVPALGGVAVSLHGLLGFAAQTLDLSLWFRIGFVSVFDVAELTLFAMMFRNADPEKGWTAQLRKIRATAWVMVGFSATMNALHAPNLIAAPVLAVIPALAAWLIELQLDITLKGKQADEEEQEKGGPGPLRLVLALWRRMWAKVFSWFGLDPKVSGGQLARAALARRAAQRAYKLRCALEELERLEKLKSTQRVASKVLQKVEKQVKKWEGKAQDALDQADTAEPDQALRLLRRMAVLTRVRDLAMVNTKDARLGLELIEELNIVASAKYIESAERATEADKARADALAAKEEALTLLEQARAELKEAKDAAAEAVGRREEEERRRNQLADERQRMESTGTSAEQLRKEALGHVEELRGQVELLQKQLGDARDLLTDAQREVTAAREEKARLEGVREELAKTRDQQQQAVDEAAELRSRSLRLEGELKTVREDRDQLKAVAAAAPAGPTSGSAQGKAGESRRPRGAGTRAVVAEAYAALPPEDRAADSHRAVARAIVRDNPELVFETVRSHLPAVIGEEQGQVPTPREETGATEEQSVLEDQKSPQTV